MNSDAISLQKDRILRVSQSRPTTARNWVEGDDQTPSMVCAILSAIFAVVEESSAVLDFWCKTGVK